MTTDKRAAAIAAIKRDTATEIDQLCYARQGEWARLGGLAIDRLTLRDLAILIADRAIEKVAALEADDGRALRELQQWCDERQSDHRDQEVGSACDADEWSAANHAGQARAFRAVVNKIGDILAAPEQPAPEPAAPHADDEDNAGTSGKGQTDGQVQEVRRQADHLPPVFPGEQVSRRVPEIPVQRGSVATNAASGDERVEERATPAQPYRGEPERVAHADDEARILAWATGPVAERTPAKAVAIMRSLAAGKAKAEAEVERRRGWQDSADRVIADLRAKLADAERERDDLREQVGDKGFSLLQQERDEAVADMLSVAQQVGIVYEAEGHAPKAGPTPAILRAIAAMQRDADDAPRLRSAGVSLKFKLTEATAERDAAVAKLAEAEKRLTTAMCNVAEAEDERNDARSSCFAAKAERDAAVAKLADAERQTQRWKVAALEMQKQRDAALAAQNARAVEELEALLRPESRTMVLGELGQMASYIHPQTVRDRIAALRAAKPEPADYADSKFGPWPGDAKPEPVPAAADAKPGDEVLRMVAGDSADNNGATGDYARAVRELCRRALEVRP